jgi:hypothetical protein
MPSRLDPINTAITVWGISVFLMMFLRKPLHLPTDWVPGLVFGGLIAALIAGLAVTLLRPSSATDVSKD